MPIGLPCKHGTFYCLMIEGEVGRLSNVGGMSPIVGGSGLYKKQA